MNAGLNIFTDFLIVLLPIPAIISLQLPRKQKIGVGLVFALGFLYVTFSSAYPSKLMSHSVCIISIVRLYALHKGTTTLDPTYDNFAIAIWSVVEVNGAIIGACLPTLKPLISRVWPKLLSSGASRHHTYHQHSTGIDDTTAHTSKGTRARSRVASGTTPDFSSATEILGDDDIVVLTEIEVKSARIQTTADDCSSHEDTGQRRNSDAWVRN
ncbi:hypothetical protein K469DRAFT_703488 [Zopfia rhizophila CBS 207.26]|uniref:Rhodopsin domain-containing protein n=1 Tax=Zopfia rhizophila CBS 207.26 TaxID=1314779 RepID=A0A6A6D6B4_9PEZI|nr:hypothetical protein K469DRAFT_703488 [Zopfia rhizophila CBS 207.26]